MIFAVKNPTKYNVGDRARAAQASLVAKRAESSEPKRYEQTANLTAHQALVEATKIIQEAGKVAESSAESPLDKGDLGDLTTDTETSTQTTTPTVAELEKSREILAEKQAEILQVGTSVAATALAKKLQLEQHLIKLKLFWETVKEVPEITKETFMSLYEPMEAFEQSRIEAWEAYKIVTSYPLFD